MKNADGIPRPTSLYFHHIRARMQLMHRIPAILATTTFVAFVVLALCTPAWRTGPFTWWPVWQLPGPRVEPVPIGLLSLLPVLCVLAWLGERLAVRQRRRWQWGSAAMTLPLLALSLLIIQGLDPAINERTVIQGIGLMLFWFSYLYALNRRPQLTLPLLIVLLVQGGVALAQFGLQRDLGLTFLGEVALDPQVPGTSVLWNSSQEVWIRGYGLTAHPNVLGAMMAVLMLLLLSHLRQAHGWRQALVVTGLTVGTLGLLVSFSRTGWIAFLVGALCWAWYENAGGRLALHQRRSLWTRRAVWLWLPFLLVPVFLLLYHDLILSRWIHLDTAIEARSIQERLRDAEVALDLIRTHPWQGAGAGNAFDAAQAQRADAGSVHNVPLLVLVEIGVLGGICWLLFMAFPLLRMDSSRPLRRISMRFHAYTPIWIGLMVAGLFDTPLWLTTSWRAALLLGILAALQVNATDGNKEEA
jgi:O-antigen ligase